MPKPLASWNPTRSVWETEGPEATPCFCGLSTPYSPRFPSSGMTRNGRLYELPTWEPPTAGSESSLLRTPAAAEAEGGPLSPSQAAREGRTLRLSGQIIDLMHPGTLPG